MSHSVKGCQNFYCKFSKTRPNRSTRSWLKWLHFWIKMNSSVSQGHFQDRESLFPSFLIIKSNHDCFTMLYNCGWTLKLSKIKQWFSASKTFVTDRISEWHTQYLRSFGSKNCIHKSNFRLKCLLVFHPSFRNY